MKVYIGAPMWGEKAWIGRYFPAGISARETLHYYSRIFPTVEVTSTYYGPPSEATLQHWKDSVPEGFRFIIKIPRELARLKQSDKGALTDFMESLGILGAALGPVFLLFKEKANQESVNSLENFIHSFSFGFQLAIQLVDESWKTGDYLKLATELLQSKNVINVIPSNPDSSLPAIQISAGDTAYIRFKGAGLANPDFQALTQWAAVISKAKKTGLKKLYFIIKSPDKPKIPELIAYFIEQLNRQAGLNLSVPKPLKGLF